METLEDDENDPAVLDAKTSIFVSLYATGIREYEGAIVPSDPTFTMYHTNFVPGTSGKYSQIIDVELSVIVCLAGSRLVK